MGWKIGEAASTQVVLQILNQQVTLASKVSIFDGRKK